jgi:hypothetical protein
MALTAYNYAILLFDAKHNSGLQESNFESLTCDTIYFVLKSKKRFSLFDPLEDMDSSVIFCLDTL